jgi:hypothetical protein
MKKLNLKKLNQFYMSGNNAAEVKRLVENAVDNFVNADVKNPLCIRVLQDLGLLLDAE